MRKLLLVGLCVSIICLGFEFPAISQGGILRDSTKVDSVITAKVDSTAKTIAPSDTTVGPVKLPTWLLSFLAAFMAILPAIQLILKRIPTQNSVRIQGVLGWILDLLTFFQRDRAPNNRDHP